MLDLKIGDMVCYEGNGTQVTIYAREIGPVTVRDGNVMCYQNDIVWIKRQVDGHWVHVWKKETT